MSVVLSAVIMVAWLVVGSQTPEAGHDPDRRPEDPADATGPGEESVAAGDLVIDLGTGVSMRLVEIKPGQFMMGSPVSEAGRDDDETQHTVTISKAFWLGQTEVTQAQWQAVMGSNPSRFKDGDDAENRPVERVTWFDAVEFCNALTRAVKAANPRLKLTEFYWIEPVERNEGRITAAKVSWIPGSNGFRLPTEAEWEYACRAGTAKAYSFGDDPSKLGEYGWFGGNSGRTPLDANDIWNKDRSNYGPRLGDNECRTHAVKGRLANAWGLFDMHGNVWEWCADWYGEYPSLSVTDPRGPSTGRFRVLRGGSWYDFSIFCRASFRSFIEPGFVNLSLGFRAARTP